MVFTKALVLKVLGGLAVCTCVTVGSVKFLGGSKTEGQGDSKPGNPQSQTSSQTQQNSPKPRSEEGTDPGSSTRDTVEPQPQQKPPGTEGNLQSSQPQPPNNVAGRSGIGAPNKADQSITNSGLVCAADTNNDKIGVCTGITEGKTINVKWEDGTKREGITSLTIPQGAKIKYEKYFSEDNYENYLKISIEGGDIALTGGTPETITKLEQFESYEIKEGEGSDKGKYYLSRKTTIFDHKIKLLNIPKTCKLVTNETEASCTLTKEQLSDLNFEGKGVKNSVHGSDESSKLKILKTTDSDFSPGGYKFTLETENNIVVSNSSNQTLYNIKSNTNTEFKIKETTPTGSGAKILTLEKAWNLDTLAAKVGITNCTTADSANECNLPATINVSNGDNDNTVGATISGTSPKIKFLQDQPKHNQGFKFNALSDIALSGGNPSVNDKKIESKGTYEIKKIEDKWYLAKVTTK